MELIEICDNYLYSISEAQQYHVYTLQPVSGSAPTNVSTRGDSLLTAQQQQYIHQQQELKGISQ